MNFIRPNKIRPTDGVSKASGMAFRNKCASAAENTVFKLGKLISSTVRVPTNIVSGTLSTFGTMTHSAARLANNTLFGDQSKTADNSTITKHKASKESQLKVESQNLKLALEKQGIIEPKINTIITNFEETAKVADISNCPVIISGGVSSIEDVKKAKDLNNKNIEGIIVGKAIYDGDIKLEELAKELDA